MTDIQIAKLRKIVADYHYAFIVSFWGPQTVPPEIVAALKEQGLIKEPTGNYTSTNAYLYGRLLQQLNTPEAAKMTFAQFQTYLKAHPIPLSPIEQQAVALAATRGAQYVVGLGNTVAQDTGRIAIEADAQLRLAMKQAIQTEVAYGIAERKTIKDIKSNLGHLTGDWTRDLDRIAATETSMAMNEGLAAEVRIQHGDDAEVSVMSQKQCCDACQKAYKGPDGAPIIFRLADLEANGTNYKKKAADKLPVVPPYHPNCLVRGTQVLTDVGLERAEDIQPGTLVYTHLGRLRPITHVWASWYDGPVVGLQSVGGMMVSVTPNHLVHDGNHFVAASTLTDAHNIVRVSHVRQAGAVAIAPQDCATLLYGTSGKDGTPFALLQLTHGALYRTGAIYTVDAQTGDKVMCQAALIGRLQYISQNGLNAICPTDTLRLVNKVFMDAEGNMVTFTRIPQDSDLGVAWTMAADSAASFFDRTPSARANNLRTPLDLKYALPTKLDPQPLFTHRLKLGHSAPSNKGLVLGPTEPAQDILGDVDLLSESLFSVNRKPYRGLVYNFTVADDQSYLANGVVVHNCACTLVHVPRGYGYNKDNYLTPKGTRGLRPHKDVTKARMQEAITLRKAQQPQHAMLNWYGLNLSDVNQAPQPGHYTAQLSIPGGTLPCLIGPHSMACDAYIAHLPQGDHVMLGFNHPHMAALAFNAHHSGNAIGPVFPGASPWSEVAVHKLAAHSATTQGTPALGGMAQGGEAIPVPGEALVRSRAMDMAKRREQKRPEPLPGRLVLPVQPPARTHQVPDEPVADLRAPITHRTVKPIDKEQPWMMAPNPRPIPVPKFILGLPSQPDEQTKELERDVAKKRIARRPVVDLDADA